MRVLGISQLGSRAQKVVQDDPRFLDVLAVEQDKVLHIYQLNTARKEPEWMAYYTEWAKITPLTGDQFRLSHMALSGRWQELDVDRTLEGCIRAIGENFYHLFFL